MQTALMRGIDHAAIRFLGRLLLLCIVLGPTQLARAQQSVQISPSVVLVLKLVSSSLVKPTTGIVISDDGMVLVSADFASEAGEIIVLDGGTDILSNGRPARLIARAGSGDLAVLSVAGLKRPGIKMSGNALSSNATLHLEAFPPAEYIAKGSQPLKVLLEVLQPRLDGSVSISPKTPLPYVSGAILDDCGYLVGVSVTRGLQSLDTDKMTPTLFAEELSRIVSAMQVTLPVAVCKRPLVETMAPVTAAITEKPALDSEEPKKPAADNSHDAPPDIASPEPVSGASIETGAQVDNPDPTLPISTNTNEPPSVWQSVPVWLPLLGILLLGVFVWKGIFFFRLSSKKPEQTAAPGSAGQVQAASDEPVTAPLAGSTDSGAIKPRSAPVPDLEISLPGTRQDGCDSVLLVEGFFDTDTPFKRFCFVDADNINIIIGRGDADIAIEHAAISRNHAHIESDGGLLTFSDMGSRNGSYIGDVPCLPGEILYFETGDEICLGDVKMTIRVVEQEAQWA